MSDPAQKFLDSLPDPDEARKNWLIDKTAEYRLMSYSVKDAKECAMKDWQTYMADDAK